MQQIIHKDTIQLEFTVEKLIHGGSKNDKKRFSCKIFFKNGNQEEVQLNEKVICASWEASLYQYWEIHFSDYTILDFTFELLQNLRVGIYVRNEQGIDQLIAQECTNLGKTISYNYYQNDFLKIGVVKVQEENDQIDYDTNYMIWEGQDLLDTQFFGKSCPFLIFYKMMYEKWEKVLETYYIKDNLNPNWNVMEISDDLLYKDNPQQLVKIECWHHSKSGKHKFIGETVFSKKGLKREFILSNKGQTKGLGILKLVQFERGQIPKFIDFLKKRRETLSFVMGIDFTKSNGNPDSFESLHNINNDKLNQYQQTLKVFGEIIISYSWNDSIEMFGFGGIPKGQDKTKFCFALNENKKQLPFYYIKNVLQVYENSVKQVKQSEPKYVAELIKHAQKSSQDQHNKIKQEYLILLIIVDGIINDMAETQQLIQDCQYLPISVIFIGVGDKDFSQMKKVFSQPDVTKDNYRQICQFESFKEYNDPVLLAQTVLKKIPEQFLKYKKVNCRAPFDYFNK